MTATPAAILKERLDERNYEALTAVDNDSLHAFIADALQLCNPETVWVHTDSPEDVEYNRQMAIEQREERPLKLQGHTIHFDGFNDQGRDREATKYLVPEGDTLSKALNQVEREIGLAEAIDFEALRKRS